MKTIYSLIVLLSFITYSSNATVCKKNDSVDAKASSTTLTLMYQGGSGLIKICGNR